MKTTQILERDFYDGVVRQNHKTGYFNMNDLVEIGNKYRKSLGLSKVKPENYWNSKSTIDFIQQVMELEKVSEIKISTRGRYGSTWVHPTVFMDMAMWVNPRFKAIVIKWMYDNLTVFRDSSGDSYKRMAGALDKNLNLGSKCCIVIPQIARKIKKALDVTDWNNATEEQLKKRDKIHENIIYGVQLSSDIDKTVGLAINTILKGNLNG